MTKRSIAEIVADLRAHRHPYGATLALEVPSKLEREAADRLTELDAELTELKAKTDTAAAKWRRVGATAPHDDGPETAA